GRLDLHHNWGLRAISLDRDALANHRLVVHSLEARLRDGTLVTVPEDGTLPALDLKPAFERASAITAFLAVPVLHVGRANVLAGGAPGAAPGEVGVRYRPDTLELEDENTGVNPQLVPVRLLNLTLLLGNPDDEGAPGRSLAGHEVLPVARLEKSPSAQAGPQL